MSEDPKAAELETREHMGRADERPPSQPATPEGLLGPGALKEYFEAAGLPELESIARTPDQLAAIQLAQQIRIATALERSATALERIAAAFKPTESPRPESVSDHHPGSFALDPPTEQSPGSYRKPEPPMVPSDR
jgi:hypothetical protein